VASTISSEIVKIFLKIIDQKNQNFRKWGSGGHPRGRNTPVNLIKTNFYKNNNWPQNKSKIKDILSETYIIYILFFFRENKKLIIGLYHKKRYFCFSLLSYPTDRHMSNANKISIYNDCTLERISRITTNL